MQIKKQPAHGVHTPEATNPSHALVSGLKQNSSFTTATTAEGMGLSAHHLTLLEARGIDVELASKMGLRTAPDGIGVEIPVYRNGVEVNSKYRTLEGDKRFHQKAGAEKCFYNVDALKEAKEIIITEGEMDCLIALQCGFTAVSVPDGAPKEQIGDKATVKYDYLSDIPKDMTKIILATDSDSAGINLMNDLALRLGKHRCQWIKYPVGCKDLNDTFLKYGRKGVEASLKTAQFMRVSGLFKLKDLPPVTEHKAYDIGIGKLADHIRIRVGDLSVVTGIPSYGKTTFVNNLTYNLIDRHGWKVCYASFEQHPQREHRRSLINLHHGQPIYDLTPEQIAEGDEWIDRNVSFIVPLDDEQEWFDMTWLMDSMAGAVTQHGCNMIVIDPWNEIDHEYDQRSTTITQYVGKAIKSLKKFAEKYCVHVMVIAHPAKLKPNKEGEHPIPTPYDISDSSHWYNKPDQIFVVHRDEENTLIRIAKSRYHYALGTPADVTVHFNRHTLRYS